MRLKDPFSLKAAEMTKRTNKPRKPRDEESSDEVSGKLKLTPSREVNLLNHQKVVHFPKDNETFTVFEKKKLQSSIGWKWKWADNDFQLNLIRIDVSACWKSRGSDVSKEVRPLQCLAGLLWLSKREDHDWYRFWSISWHCGVLKMWFPGKYNDMMHFTY